MNCVHHLASTLHLHISAYLTLMNKLTLKMTWFPRQTICRRNRLFYKLSNPIISTVKHRGFCNWKRDNPDRDYTLVKNVETNSDLFFLLEIDLKSNAKSSRTRSVERMKTNIIRSDILSSLFARKFAFR